MAMFFLSHFFSVITYQPLLNDLCELIFFISDEKVIEEMCTPVRLTVNRNQECYLSEPKSLTLLLSTLNSNNKKDKNNSLKSSKNRSRSTPHFPTLIKETASDTTSANQSLNADKKVKFSVKDEDVVVDVKNDTETSDTEITFNNLIVINDCTSLQVESNPMNDLQSKNVTDDEKYRQIKTTDVQQVTKYGVVFEMLMMHLNTHEYSELNCLIALTFLHSMINNEGVPGKFIESLQSHSVNEVSDYYESWQLIHQKPIHSFLVWTENGFFDLLMTGLDTGSDSTLNKFKDNPMVYTPFNSESIPQKLIFE